MLSRMKKIKIIFIVLFCLVITSCKNQDNVDILQNLESEFVNSFNFDLIMNESNNLIIKSNNKNEILKIQIENISFNNVNQTIEKKFLEIESLYREIHSPYPGIVSNKVSCENNYLPKKIENYPKEYLIVYATERLTFGACSKDLIHYQSIIYPIYCNKKLFTFNLFIPLSEQINKYEDKLNKIKCKKEN